MPKGTQHGTTLHSAGSGTPLHTAVGSAVGTSVGDTVGTVVGTAVGGAVGAAVGTEVGAWVHARARHALLPASHSQQLSPSHTDWVLLPDALQFVVEGKKPSPFKDSHISTGHTVRLHG